MSPQNAFVLITGLAAAAVVAAVIALARRRARRLSLEKLLPDSAQVSAMGDDRLRSLSRSLAEAIEETGKTLPKHEAELLHHALWHAMLLMACADHEIDREEIDSVTRLFGSLVSKEPDRGSVAQSIELAWKDRSTSLSEISKAAGVSTQAKTLIFRGAYLVSLANQALDPGEVDLLQEIANVLDLKIGDIELGAG